MDESNTNTLNVLESLIRDYSNDVIFYWALGNEFLKQNMIIEMKRSRDIFTQFAMHNVGVSRIIELKLDFIYDQCDEAIKGFYYNFFFA